MAPGEVAGVGIDGQSWSAIPLDKEGRALCNTPIWMDTRAGSLCQELEARVGGEKIFACSGNPLVRLVHFAQGAVVQGAPAPGL